MKKLFLLLTVLFTVNFAFAQDTTTVLEKVTKRVVDAKNTVDTASLYKEIYTDVKTGLQSLASGLKVGVEHVYSVLVKQQVVKSVGWLIIWILSVFMLINWFRSYKSNEVWIVDEEYPSGLGIIRILQIVIFGIVFIVCLCNIDETVTGFINPEYGALKEIMDFVKDSRHE